MSTTREMILTRLAEIMAQSGGFFPEAEIDEPSPSAWHLVAEPGEGDRKLLHALAVQDGPPPEHLSRAHGGADDDTANDELELEAAIAYGVRVDGGLGDDRAAIRRARRARRDQAIPVIAHLIAADRTLGLGPEVYAEVAPAARDDDVTLPNAPACATVIVPIRVLYTAAHAAD